MPDLIKDKNPKPGTLDPGKPIDMNLIITGAIVQAIGEIGFACAEKGLTLVNTQLEANQISQGIISLDEESTLYQNQDALSTAVIFNFLDAAS